MKQTEPMKVGVQFKKEVKLATYFLHWSRIETSFWLSWFLLILKLDGFWLWSYRNVEMARRLHAKRG